MRPDPTLADARRATRRVARTFGLACRLLPRSVRGDVYRLYLVFRTLDDLVDDGDPGAADALVAVECWAAGGPASTPETRTLATVDERHALPRHALRDFCLGMRDDLAGNQPQTEADVDGYCYRVAGTVGLVMAAILDAPPETVPAAVALGSAMQRTNIVRDIDEDLQAGRVYVASNTIDRFGGSLSPAARGPLVADQITRADALYEQAAAGIDALPTGGLAIRAAAAMYREILREIERRNGGTLYGRAQVPLRRKLTAVMLAHRHRPERVHAATGPVRPAATSSRDPAA